MMVNGWRESSSVSIAANISQQNPDWARTARARKQSLIISGWLAVSRTVFWFGQKKLLSKLNWAAGNQTCTVGKLKKLQQICIKSNGEKIIHSFVLARLCVSRILKLPPCVTRWVETSWDKRSGSVRVSSFPNFIELELPSLIPSLPADPAVDTSISPDPTLSAERPSTRTGDTRHTATRIRGFRQSFSELIQSTKCIAQIHLNLCQQ